MTFIDYQPPKECTSPEHNPPSYMVQKPGQYIWQCPSCGKKSTVVVCGNIKEGTWYKLKNGKFIEVND